MKLSHQMTIARNVAYSLPVLTILFLPGFTRADMFLSFLPDVTDRDAGSVTAHLIDGGEIMLGLYLVETGTSDLENFGLVTNGLRLSYPTTPNVGFVSSVATAPGFTMLAPNLISGGLVQHTSATTAADDVVRPSSQGLGHASSVLVASLEVTGSSEGTMVINVERPRTIDNATEVSAFFVDDGSNPRHFRDDIIFASTPTATVEVTAIPEPAAVMYLSLLTIASVLIVAYKRNRGALGRTPQ